MGATDKYLYIDAVAEKDTGKVSIAPYNEELGPKNNVIAGQVALWHYPCSLQ